MLKPAKKYFIPHEDNDYKPHFLRKTSVALLSVVIVFAFFSVVYQNVAILKTDLLSAVIPRTLVDLANSNRSVNNLTPLKVSPILEEAALRKAQDMALNGYFAHVSPQGKSPWFWFNSVGYNYIYAGENLAVNFSESINVDQAWMNSPTHRANILNGKFTEIGIATAHGFYDGKETVFVVQMFGRPFPSILANQNTVPTQSEETVKGVATDEADLVEDVVLDEPVESIEPVEEPIVISETDTFIAVQNSEAIALEESVSTSENIVPESQSSVIDRGLANPGRTLSLFYRILIGIILIALTLTVFIEIKKQHIAPAVFAILLIVLILILLFVYKNLFLVPVLVV